MEFTYGRHVSSTACCQRLELVSADCGVYVNCSAENARADSGSRQVWVNKGSAACYGAHLDTFLTFFHIGAFKLVVIWVHRANFICLYLMLAHRTQYRCLTRDYALYYTLFRDCCCWLISHYDSSTSHVDSTPNPPQKTTTKTPLNFQKVNLCVTMFYFLVPTTSSCT